MYKFIRTKKVKDFADDLTVILSSTVEHQSALSQTDSKCKSLDLDICPDKCFSLVLSNGKPISKCFSLNNGATNSAAVIPNKFLGHLIGAKLSTT